MRSADLLTRVIAPLRGALVAALEAQGWPATVVSAIAELLDFAAVAVVGALIVLVTARLFNNSAWRQASVPVTNGTPRGSAMDSVLRWLGAAVAVALLAYMLANPSPHVGELFTRADHIAFSAVVGALLAGAAPALRAWMLGAISVAFIWSYCGSVATAITLATVALGFAALGGSGAAGARRNTLVLAGLGLAAYAVCLLLRGTLFVDGLQTFAILSFVFLRQISAATALSSAPRPPFSGYLCYLTFYPGGFGPVGGPEVYSDFARRNLGSRLHHDAGHAARSIVWGAAQVWAAYRIPTSSAALLDSSTFLVAWQHSLLMFVRAALYSMGLWSMVDATALLHGFRLHPNFRGVLTRQNPSELWWAWRGTLTNWLVRHVYGPLGANQHHQSLNILAAFAVSWLWHVVGVPFLGREFTLLNLAPITLWAVINAAAVIGHVHARQHQLRILPLSTPAPLRRGIHIFLTACLGTTSVTLLQFQGGQIDRFVPFLRVLVGLG